MSTINYEYLKENGLILFQTVVGSQAYGTNIETSDVDMKFVYILPEDNVLGFNYVPQLDVNKDFTGWEIKRFLELLSTNNPTVTELLNSPEDCVMFKHPLFDSILKDRDMFITKMAKNSFGGYARQQVAKAKGLDKKQNWEKDKVTRKDLLDFCYVIEGEKAIPWRVWNGDAFDVSKIGAVTVPNAKDAYALFYDNDNSLKYKGLVKVGEEVDGVINYGLSNQLRTSSVPKGETSFAVISFNKDGYSKHCKDFSEYQEWLENRNESRYVETKGHGQKIDGKNMMHCMRLIRMANEIGSGLGVNVRRPDREYLLSIRRGEVDLDELIDIADSEINKLDDLFDNSNLPDSIDKEYVNQMLIKIRKDFYKK